MGHGGPSRVGVALADTNIHVYYKLGHSSSTVSNYGHGHVPRDNETRSSVFSSYILHTHGPRCRCDHDPLAIHRCYTTLPTYTPTGLLATGNRSIQLKPTD